MGPININILIACAKYSINILLLVIIAYGLIVYAPDTVHFDGSDTEDLVSKESASSESNKDIVQDKATNASDYSSNSKWYVETIKFAYEKMMEHEFNWLEEEKEEYERTKVLPENSLHSHIAEFREQDAKEMTAINEALNKFNLNENPNDIGSSDNKRSIVEEDQFTASEENKKSRIVAENETNVDKKCK